MNCATRQIKIAKMYKTAKEAVIEGGFGPEINWQESLQFSQITESDFLREAAWVVLSAGMRESVIRKKFAALSAAFHRWASARKIVADKGECRYKALSIFRSERKIDAIITIAEEVDSKGFFEVQRQIEHEGIGYIRQLPFMGPATSLHLAKNLGLPVVKPDRHLVRVARQTGYRSPEAMCREIAEVVGDRISVVDLVIWRYATLDRDYLKLFSLRHA